jgi:hypothetical protein
LLGYPKTMKFRYLQGNLTQKKKCMTVFEFIGQFFFQNDFLNIKKSFQSMESEYSLRRVLEASRHFLFYRFETKTDVLKTFQKQF